MAKWKVLDSEYHFTSPFGNLRKDTCQMTDGTIIHAPVTRAEEMIQNKKITQLFTVTAYYLAKELIRNGREKE